MEEQQKTEEQQQKAQADNRSKTPLSPRNPKPTKFNFYWIYGVIAVVLIVMNIYNPTASVSKEVPFTEFESYVKNNTVENMVVYINRNVVQAFIKQDSLKSVFGQDIDVEKHKGAYIESRFASAEVFDRRLTEMQQKYGFSGNVNYKESDSLLSNFFWSFGPLILLVLFWIFFMNRMSGGRSAGGGMGSIFSVGRSKAKLFDKDTPQDKKVTFKDVAGLTGAKQEIEEIVSFLKNPAKYTELGGKIPKGALLVGPPGTGKTLLAKAVAGEADVPFFSMSGSDFVEMFVGVGASRVRDLFRQAKDKSPCIIFIDEIDAVGRSRASNIRMGGNDERENTLNQLLTEMDGFGSNSGVIILAATNRADILDKALLRAGRFDRQIHVDLPDVHERKDIFIVHLRNIKTDESVDIDFLARQTPGFSGADIANVCNEAALIAARHNKSAVQKQDFLDAVDRIVGGLEKKSKITTEAEKRSIAFHEAGHATISWKLQYANPLVKVTIVPRGRALGAAWYLPEERQLTTADQMFDEICTTLGGRASEEITFNRVSTGALNDLERTTRQAYAMVAYYGMSDNLKNISFYDSSGSSEYSFSKPYSEKTAETIDKETQKIVDEQYERARKILLENREGLIELAELLVEKEVIFSDDMERIFGKRPWKSRTDELMEESEKQVAPVETSEEFEQSRKAEENTEENC